MLLCDVVKIAPDLAARVDAARSLADDPAGPRTAIAASAAGNPLAYVDRVADRRGRAGLDGDGSVQELGRYVEGVGGPALGDFRDFAPERATELYDGLPSGLRTTYDAAWKRVAHEWIDATLAMFADGPAEDDPVRRPEDLTVFQTVDGGTFAVLAVDDEFMTGIHHWREAFAFVVGHVATELGVTVPTRFDVT